MGMSARFAAWTTLALAAAACGRGADRATTAGGAGPGAWAAEDHTPRTGYVQVA